MLSDAVDEGIIMANPASQVGRHKTNRAERLASAEYIQKVRPMSWEQRDTFLAAAALCHRRARSLCHRRAGSPRGAVLCHRRAGAPRGAKVRDGDYVTRVPTGPPRAAAAGAPADPVCAGYAPTGQVVQVGSPSAIVFA